MHTYDMHMHAYDMHMPAYDMHMHAHDTPKGRIFTPMKLVPKVRECGRLP